MIKVIYFLECAFVIGDLDCMTLLNNVHILCIIASKFRLIGPPPAGPARTPLSLAPYYALGYK
jgi:hypothetical protein